MPELRSRAHRFSTLMPRAGAVAFSLLPRFSYAARAILRSLSPKAPRISMPPTRSNPWDTAFSPRPIGHRARPGLATASAATVIPHRGFGPLRQRVLTSWDRHNRALSSPWHRTAFPQLAPGGRPLL